MLLAKMYVNSVEKGGYPSYPEGMPQTTFVKVHLTCVHAENDPHGANKKFAKATPSGEMTLHIDNPEAFDWFQPGGYIYVPLCKPEEVGRVAPQLAEEAAREVAA